MAKFSGTFEIERSSIVAMSCDGVETDRKTVCIVKPTAGAPAHYHGVMIPDTLVLMLTPLDDEAKAMQRAVKA